MFYLSRAEQAVLVVLVLLLLLGAGVLVHAKGQHSVGAGAREPVFVPAPGEASRGEVVVDVAGAVARPGPWHLPAGSRLTDAIAVAGGLAPGADTSGLNLAARLHDGERIVIPGAQQPRSAAPKAAAIPQPARPISLNKASATELELLPGIGPVYAERIIAYRQQKVRQEGHGFETVDELLNVPGIGPKRFAAIRELVTP
ncbi:MAG: ComEA family DNA-binding protein [Armatimonadetes bacterium]|nr:ComEA family DNA-binding protein [Armatimonadota bacterium]